MMNRGDVNSVSRLKTGTDTFDWKSYWTEIDAVSHTAHPYAVFEILAQNPDWPFVPIVDENRRPIGVVREYSLKGYAYARFGRELIQRRRLSDFIEPVAVVSCNTSSESLLVSGSKNPNPDGLVLVENGVYRAALLNLALLRLHEEHHLKTQARLAHIEKMEAIGTLAGGIAHDLNNILTPLLGYAGLVREAVENGDPVSLEMLDQIIISANRGRKTVKQILTFSRQQELVRSPMHLGNTVREVLGLIGCSLPASVEIEMKLETDRDIVLACPSEMHQVLMNLCTNAYHAMQEKGGRMVVSLAEHAGPPLGWSPCTELPRTGAVRVSVGDEGSGIDPEVLPRIFEPFFTTKPQGSGTGMGLAIVHGIMTRTGGAISVETQVGRGTTFHFYVPQLEVRHPAIKELVVPRSAGIKGSASLPKIRMLMVDDETQIVRLGEEVFSRFSIEVCTKTDSLQALALFQEDPYAFDVLMTDQMMPGMKGSDLTRHVLAIRPELPVILCTGYADALGPEQAAELGIREYILKPLDFSHLAKIIRSWFPADVPA